MVKRITVGVFILALSACAPSTPSLPGSETVDRARDVAEQLDQREDDLMGGLDG